MYVTGGLGSQSFGERFTIGYDLPSDTAYAETCASIGLVFWAQRMLLCDPRSEYADVIETAVFNGILSGVSLDGSRYFYVNPLEVQPDVARYRHDHAHVETGRIPWFGCACCPPNIARLIASFSRYFYTMNGSTVWVHQYGGSRSDASRRLVTRCHHAGHRVPVERESRAWCRGRAGHGVHPRAQDPVLVPVLHVFRQREAAGADHGQQRVPGDHAPLVGRDTVVLDLAMPVLFIQADPRVPELAGKLAIRRGPLIYCVESCDNGPDLHLLTLNADAETTAEFRQDLMGGTCVVHARGYRSTAGAAASGEPGLYRVADRGQARKPVKLTAVPYHQWGNREANGEMTVWLRSS